MSLGIHIIIYTIRYGPEIQSRSVGSIAFCSFFNVIARRRQLPRFLFSIRFSGITHWRMFARGIQKSSVFVRPVTMNFLGLRGQVEGVLGTSSKWTLQNRMFSAESREYMDYVIKSYVPSGPQRTKEEVIRDLIAPKLSNERVGTGCFE